MYTENNTIMVVHAAPKTHPAGVHGALFKDKYQSVLGPSFINQAPIAKAERLAIRNIKNRMYLFSFKFFPF